MDWAISSLSPAAAVSAGHIKHFTDKHMYQPETNALTNNKKLQFFTPVLNTYELPGQSVDRFRNNSSDLLQLNS